jgi:hypothetical protein
MAEDPADGPIPVRPVGFDWRAAEINTSFRDVSIVEIGFVGNVLREIYRISLENGSVVDGTTGKEMPGMKKS